jgi:hypothetical protein
MQLELDKLSSYPTRSYLILTTMIMIIISSPFTETVIHNFNVSDQRHSTGSKRHLFQIVLIKGNEVRVKIPKTTVLSYH